VAGQAVRVRRVVPSPSTSAGRFDRIDGICPFPRDVRGWQYLVWRRLGSADELAEESSFGKQLMLEDVSDRGGAEMRTEYQILVGEPAHVEKTLFVSLA